MNGMRIFVVIVCVALCAVPSAFAQDDTGTAMEEAKRLYRQGDYRGALERLDAAVASDERPDALYLIGYAHLMLSEYAAAVEAFGRSFSLDQHFDPRTIFQRPSA